MQTQYMQWGVWREPTFCSCPGAAGMFLKAVSELLHLPSTCDFSLYNHPATGSMFLCAIQDLWYGVSDVCGVRILYLTAEGQFVLCSQEEDVTKFVLEFNDK